MTQRLFVRDVSPSIRRIVDGLENVVLLHTKDFDALSVVRVYFLHPTPPPRLLLSRLLLSSTSDYYYGLFFIRRSQGIRCEALSAYEALCLGINMTSINAFDQRV
jgi:hypothetical protein